MSKENIDQSVAEQGLNAWRAKVAADRKVASAVLAKGPNPWHQATWDTRLQNIISHLAPGVAARMKVQANAP